MIRRRMAAMHKVKERNPGKKTGMFRIGFIKGLLENISTRATSSNLEDCTTIQHNTTPCNKACILFLITKVHGATRDELRLMGT